MGLLAWLFLAYAWLILGFLWMSAFRNLGFRFELIDVLELFPRGALFAIQTAQVLEWVDAGLVSVAPEELDRVATDVVDGARMHVGPNHRRCEDALAGHLVDTTGARTVHTQEMRCVDGLVPVLPPDGQRGCVLGGSDVGGSDLGSGHRARRQ